MIFSNYYSKYSNHTYKNVSEFIILCIKTYLNLTYGEICEVTELSSEIHRILKFRKFPIIQLYSYTKYHIIIYADTHLILSLQAQRGQKHDVSFTISCFKQYEAINHIVLLQIEHDLKTYEWLLMKK
ncbi:hypothetical protein SAMN02910297_01821 [Methanobrevibacter olleyae]|uniref:Uncharacterized protein n=1 Tax=Methanobrevibacter olleyae TaxID=294671 RepID=A0A1I4KSH0_METOL|nr:hypothetical protein SAMN02910297_01821 [Methanobrevibacter olleyae]